MSRCGTLETEIKEQKYLIAALAEMGYHPEVHADGAPLIRYEGHERRKGRTSSYSGGNWTRRRMTSASQRQGTADTPRNSASTTGQLDLIRNG